MGRLIQAHRRATLTEITTRYNRGMQQSICEGWQKQNRKNHQPQTFEMYYIDVILYTCGYWTPV